MTGRIFLPVASGPFWRFTKGTKVYEVRQASSPVARQVLRSPPGTAILLRRGYSTRDERHGHLGDVHVAPDWPSLPEPVRRGADRRGDDPPLSYYDPARPVVAFAVLDLAREAYA